MCRTLLPESCQIVAVPLYFHDCSHGLVSAFISSVVGCWLRMISSFTFCSAERPFTASRKSFTLRTARSIDALDEIAAAQARRKRRGLRRDFGDKHPARIRRHAHGGELVVQQFAERRALPFGLSRCCRRCRRRRVFTGGISGVRAMARSRGERTPNWSIGKFSKPSFNAGEPSLTRKSPFAASMNSGSPTSEFASQPLSANFLPVGLGGREQVAVHFLAPLGNVHAGRAIRAHDDVAGEDVAAVLEPDVRVEAVVDDDVVRRDAAVALAQLQAAVEQQVVVDHVIGWSRRRGRCPSRGRSASGCCEA